MTIEQMKQSCEIFIRSGLHNESLEADHDVICGPYMGTIREKVSSEDILALEKLGWHESDEYDCFAHFV